MPARGDHDERRREVSEAVWRVLATRGFDGLTLRAIAGEMDVSTGMLTHYFPSKRALVEFALGVAGERTEHRAVRRPSEPGFAALRAALLDVLPLTPETTAMSRVWVSSWGAALSDPDLGAQQTDRYVRWRARLRRHVEDARRMKQLAASRTVDDLVAVSAAFAHGLVVQALFDPKRFPPAKQIRLLDRFLETLRASA